MDCTGAVRFFGQAQFHPLKFICELANGLQIYEDTVVTEVEDHLIRTSGGNVLAAQIVFADRKSTRLNSSHITRSRMPSSA